MKKHFRWEIWYISGKRSKKWFPIPELDALHETSYIHNARAFGRVFLSSWLQLLFLPNSSLFHKHTHKTSVWIPLTRPGCLASAGWPQGESSLLAPRFPLLFIPWVEKEQNALMLALSWCLGHLVVWILTDFMTAGGTRELCKGETQWHVHGVSLLCLHSLKGSCVWKSSVRKMTAWATSSVWLLKWEVNYFQHMNWLTIKDCFCTFSKE